MACGSCRAFKRAAEICAAIISGPGRYAARSVFYPRLGPWHGPPRGIIPARYSGRADWPSLAICWQSSRASAPLMRQASAMASTSPGVGRFRRKLLPTREKLCEL